MKTAVAVAAATLLAFAATGCGSQEEASPEGASPDGSAPGQGQSQRAAPGTPTAPAVARLSAKKRKKALLSLEDLPAGFTEEGTRSVLESGPPECERLYDKFFAPAEGVEFASFEKDSGESVSSTVRTVPPGTGKAFVDSFASVADHCIGVRLRSTGEDSRAQASFTRESFPSLMDQSSALRMELSLSVGTAQGHSVIFRRGDNIGQVTYLAAFREGTTETIGYARRGANHLRDAVNGS